MASLLVDTITSSDPSIRNRPLDELCSGLSLQQLLAECAALEEFRHRSGNLYERVRALFFLYAVHRFHVPGASGGAFPWTDSLPWLRASPGTAVRRGDQRISRSSGTGRGQRGNIQCIGRGLSPSGVSNVGRSGTAQRQVRPRKSVDVQSGAPVRPAASHPAGDADADTGWALSCSSRGHAREDGSEPQWVE